MTDTPPVEPDDEDELAELLLADAVPLLDQPDTGAETPPPDMGDPLTQPAQPNPGTQTDPPAPPAPQPPAPPVPPPPAPPTPPAPTPAPQFVAPVPAPGQPPASGGTGQPGQAPATGTDPSGFPANTPWRDMTPDQQVAYWQHQARKHEDRVRGMSDYDQLRQKADEYERLVTASQTEHERAVAEARRQGHASALAEAGGQLVEQWLRAAAAGRLPEESVNALLAGLDRSRFLTPQGGVDTDKVYALVTSVAPPSASAPTAPANGTPGQPVQPAPQPVQAPPSAAPTRGPDFGQGHPGSAKPTGLAAGRDIARQRFGLAAANTPTQ